MTKQVFLFLFLLFCCCSTSADDDWEPTANEHVLDFTSNPILQPTELFEWLVADPTVITIGKDIHMFANEVFHGILHFTADPASPTNFTKQDTIIPFPGSVRPYVHLEEDTLYLVYEQYQLPLFRTSHIMLRKAKVSIDASGLAVLDWEKTSITLLVPELEWEKIGTERVGNPFVFYSSPHSEYRMYYSASSTHLDDSNIDEPLYLGLARSPSLTGPWERVSYDPIPVAETGLPGKEILGIGSIKLVKSTSTKTNTTDFVALCNRVTRDSSSSSTGSTISLISSTTEGLSWDVLIGELIPPTTDDTSSWKHAYVYGYDSMADLTDDSYFLVYYNGRDGWRQGVEAIGVSRVDASVLP